MIKVKCTSYHRLDRRSRYHHFLTGIWIQSNIFVVFAVWKYFLPKLVHRLQNSLLIVAELHWFVIFFIFSIVIMENYIKSAKSLRHPDKISLIDSYTLILDGTEPVRWLSFELFLHTNSRTIKTNWGPIDAQIPIGLLRSKYKYPD